MRIAAIAALLLLLGSVLHLPDPALPWVLAAGVLLGAAFVLLDYGFTAPFRVLLTERDGRPLASRLVVPGVAALAILPVAASGADYARFVAPVGLSLLVGAIIFGVGMQIANGCGSGTLIAAGQGARRMWVTLPFFCVGGVLGSLALPTALTWPSLGEFDLLQLFGPAWGLLATEALLTVVALLLLKGGRPGRRQLWPGLIIGALAALMFLVSGEPWGVTMGLTVAGAQAVEALGFQLAETEFWANEGGQALLRQPLFAMHGALGDAGLLLGALLAAAWRGSLRFGVAIGPRAIAGGVLGGLLMGVGARLSFGCNIGAFVGGIASGSLHGFVWMFAVLPGCWLGVKLRPFFAT